jgi:hypothetical protein
MDLWQMILGHGLLEERLQVDRARRALDLEAALVADQTIRGGVRAFDRRVRDEADLDDGKVGQEGV